MKTNQTIVRMAVLSALVTLTACHTNSTPQSAHDPWEIYKLGGAHDCDAPGAPDMRHNSSNLPTPGFGCSHQSNIAVMAANPEDLHTPREMTPSDAVRSQRILEAYRAGEDTSTRKQAQGADQLIE